MKYIYKLKSLKGHYTITWWKAKLSKKRRDSNNNDNNKRKIQTANYLNLVWTIVRDGSVNIYIEKCELFKWLKSKYEGHQIF